MRHKMDTSYVAARAMTWRETMALKATRLPRPMREISMTKPKTTRRALRGEPLLLSTFATKLRNGRPSSRANAKTCREVDAMKFVTLKTMRIIWMLARVAAPWT